MRISLSHKAVWLWGALSLAGVACGESHQMVDTGEELPEFVEPLETPMVRLVSPPVWEAGDVVTVLGNDFVRPDRGHTLVRLSGSFVEEDGEDHKVDMTVRTEYRNAGKIDFVFEPAYPPNGFGHSIGVFNGDVIAINVDDETSLVSEPLSSQVDVGPSLIIWGVQPTSCDCPQRDRITATLDGEEIEVDLEAIGLTPTTAYTPLDFTASFVDLAGEAQVISKKIAGGTGTRLELPVGVLQPGVVSSQVGVTVSVEDGHGIQRVRYFAVDVGLEHSVAYDGNIRIVELYAPVQVSSCLPGGEYGRSVGYSSGESESRSRSVSLSANIGLSLWVVNVGFGINVSQSVSSGQSESLSMNGHIYGGQYGVFYRQTQRLERLGKIMQRGTCGDEIVVGDARVTDWNWAPDLAVTTNGVCPPAPPSNLPSAQVFP